MAISMLKTMLIFLAILTFGVAFMVNMIALQNPFKADIETTLLVIALYLITGVLYFVIYKIE